MVQKQKLIQAIGDAVIPLLGFFFFDWGLYFILLFYFIDLFSNEIFLHVKANKIVTFQSKLGVKKSWLTLGVLSFIFMLAIVLMTHLVMSFIDTEIKFYKELIEFLSYEEAGLPIAQGYILLPLVVFGNYQQYKMFFLTPAKYRVLTVNQIFNSRIKVLSLGLIGALIALVVAYFIHIPEVIYLIILVGVKFYVDFKISNE